MIKIFKEANHYYGTMQERINEFLRDLRKPYTLHVTSTGSHTNMYLTVVVEYDERD